LISATGWTVDGAHAYVDDAISGAEFRQSSWLSAADERIEAAADVSGSDHVGR
jgi:hypothetical protein